MQCRRHVEFFLRQQSTQTMLTLHGSKSKINKTQKSICILQEKQKNDFQRRLAGSMEELSIVRVAGLLAPVIPGSMVLFSNSAKKPTFLSSMHG